VGRRTFRFGFMPAASSRLLLIVLVLATAARAQLPALSGELRGDFVPPVAGAPNLRWELTLKTAPAGRREGSLTVAAPGLKAEVAVETDAAFAVGSWRLIAAELEPGPWLALLAPQFAPALVGSEVTGTVRLNGAGTLHQGQPAGLITIEWRDGAVTHPAQGWALAGVALRGEFLLDAAAKTWSSTGPAELTVRSITTKRFGARSFSILFRMDEKLAPRVESARIEIAGGEIVAAPFSVPLVPPAIDVKLRLTRIGLQDVVALVPTGLSEGRGRVDGELQVGWSKALGLQIGAGQLNLRSDEPMTLRLAAAPGLLSASMPERFALLPAWFGPFSRWFSPVNPGFADLVAIELGRTALQVESLDVRLTPEGDDRGRSARVLVKARPEVAGTSVGSVSFEIDVNGPLAYVLRLGAENGATLNVR
jgi:hypothetical protein